MKKFFLPLCTLYFVLCTFAYANSSPVVQIVAYKEPLGMYYSMQGWGSGSIIDTAGHILTNNHVVDDGFGQVSDDFSVCITDDTTQPPKCHYTASVVARDSKKDIALLKLDSTDIFGNSVNLTNFSTLPIDYTYAPAVSDLVIARGYPWVGANTITETQGIISGSYVYNENTYIKTDALIAGGNSGGPLIREGKMVGINTFIIGDYSDPSLGYSLSVREVQNFIQSAITKTIFLQTNSSGFDSFLQTITGFTDKKQFTDTLITINFPQKYTITTYIPGVFVDGQIAEENDTSVYQFAFLHFRTPPLKTTEEIEYFLSKNSLLPFWGGVKLKTITLGGQSFYEVNTLGSTGGDKTKTEYMYFTIIDETHLILLSLSAPFSKESTYDAIQKNVKDFLAGVSFPSQFNFSSDATIQVKDANVGLKVSKNTTIDYVGIFFPDGGIVSELLTSYDDLFTIRTYLGNLWSYVQMSIIPNSFYTEDTSMDELLDRFKESPYFSPSNDAIRITYKGYEGFTICDNNQYGNQVEDERGVEHETTSCEAIFFIGPDNSHFLSLKFLVEKRKKSEMQFLMIQYLDSFLEIDEIGETNFGEAKTDLPYTDIDNQSSEFRETLKNLVQYGILTPRTLFEGDRPLIWEEYIRLYIWAIYHKRLNEHILSEDSSSPTFEAIVRKMPVDLKAYVNSSQVEYFDLLFRIHLAGVTLPAYTELSLTQFKEQKDILYYDEWGKIDDFEYAYFKGKKMTPNGGTSYYYNSGFYTPAEYFMYNPVFGLSSEPALSQEPLKFDANISDTYYRLLIESQLECTKTSAQYFSATCFKKRQEHFWSLLSYFVLTKGGAIELIAPEIDYALWDEDLAKKKTIKIEVDFEE